MLTTLLAATVFSQIPAMVCPVAGDTISDTSARYEYAGLVTALCCAGCEGSLKANTEKLIASKRTNYVAYSLYDVVSKEAIKPDKAVAFADVNGVRYNFSSKEHKAAFDKDTKKYTARPTLEAFGKCVVTGEAVPAGKFAAYRDVMTELEGKQQVARVYFCCMGCVPKFDANPADFVAAVKFSKATVHEIKN